MAVACYREVTGEEDIARCIAEALPQCFKQASRG
jgi:hypothetical protein